MANNKDDFNKITVKDLLRKTREAFASEINLREALELQYRKKLFPIQNENKSYKNNVGGVSIFSWRKIDEFSDEDFINNAYHWVLHRAPDQLGKEYFLKSLKKNKMSRVEILGRLRFSPEGRKIRACLKGLTARLAAELTLKIPIFGYILRIIINFLGLPIIIKKIQDFSIHAKRKFTIIDNRQESMNLAFDNLSRQLMGISQDITQIKIQLIDKADFSILHKQQNLLDKIKGEIDKILNRIDCIEKSNNIKPFSKISLNFPLPSSFVFKNKINPISSDKLDLLYFRLEEKFRGSREQVKERQKIYLPYIQKVGAGTQERPILDLGCGRGEWLELLKERGLKASGVDINAYMVQFCIDQGLNVFHEEILSFLKRQKDNSWGALTGFHLIEHLSFMELLIFLNESYRILSSGGIIILETPNPENMHVGSWFFYHDPTHRNPIPPVTLEFLVKEEGFSNVQIMRLHPFKNQDLKDELIDKILFGPTDYAIIAFKVL